MNCDLNFEMIANNDGAIDLYIMRRRSKLPLNLTGCRIIWQAFENGNPVITKDSQDTSEIMVFDQSQSQNLGRLRLFTLPADTVNLDTGINYIHEFVVVDTFGKVLNVSEDDPFLTAGEFYLRRQYTVQPA